MSEVIERPKRTSELVVERMERLIRDGVWPVGTCIPAEPELVRDFGVGRNTIREAVRALEHSGMLVPRRGDGTYVRSANTFAAAMTRTATSEMLDLLQVRRALESEAAAGAARDATADAKRELREALDTAEGILATGDIDAYARADIDFHTKLVAASGNPLLIEIYSGVLEVMHRAHADIAGLSVVANAHPGGHRDVVAAIDAGDEQAARAAVVDYLAEAEGSVRR